MKCAVCLILLVVISSTWGAEKGKESLPRNQVEVIFARVTFAAGTRSLSLLELHRAATERLERRYADFKEEFLQHATEWSLPSARINPNSEDQFLELMYGGAIGGKAWFVVFSKDGKITLDRSARVAD